jgi:hypothetical protein
MPLSIAWKQKVYMQSRPGNPTPERGRRSKRFFRVTAQGMSAVNRTHRALRNLTEGLDILRSTHDTSGATHSPRLAAWLVDLLASAEQAGSILGDLHEEFSEIVIATVLLASTSEWVAQVKQVGSGYVTRSTTNLIKEVPNQCFVLSSP